ncbi:MAG: glycosyltransferase [Flavipsychrobacter sp.]|nr:glycosyltransferase [Flavipsychrobacter sp.]
MFYSILLAVLLLSVAVQCVYALGIFSRIYRLPVPERDNNTPRLPVSVIICARNEAANLRRNLPLVMAQRYSNEAGKALYEVIVVNDCSTDDTEEVLREMEQQYDGLWHVTISPGEPRIFPGKKFALSEGVKHAGHNLLLLTDADCAPAGPHWLDMMTEPLRRGGKIAAGYGKYARTPGVLNAFTRWETLHTFLQYSTYALCGRPYMAVGRNLACMREAYTEASTSAAWSLLPSGDDDLLVAAAGGKDNVAIVCHPEAFTITGSKATWREWIAQKQRHLSTGKYYKKNIQALLGLYALSHSLMWLSFAGVVAACPGWALAAVGLRMVSYLPAMYRAARRTGEASLAPAFLVFDIGWMIYNFAFAPYIALKNKTQWK